MNGGADAEFRAQNVQQAVIRPAQRFGVLARTQGLLWSARAPEFQIRVPRAFVNRESLIDEISQHFDFPAHLITLSRLRGYSACTAGLSITLTCPTTIRHPSSKRTYNTSDDGDNRERGDDQDHR